MELDAVDRERPVPHGHDLAVRCGRADLQLVRDPGGGQRVVAPGLEPFGKAAEDPLAVVLHGRRLAVDELARRADLPAECLDDRLVPEADAERGSRPCEAGDDRRRCTGGVGPAGTGRDDEVRRSEPLGLVGVELVVPAHHDLHTELAEQVGEVERETVVVVDEEHHERASASLIAVSSAASFWRHSSCSSFGSESATIPAPACRNATPSCSTIVRIAMQVSRASPGSA